MFNIEDIREKSEFGGDMSMVNPFNFTNPVSPSRFAGRAKILKHFDNIFIDFNHGKVMNLAILGERAIGKTSLIKYLDSKLSNTDYIPVYIPLDRTVDDIIKLFKIIQLNIALGIDRNFFRKIINVFHGNVDATLELTLPFLTASVALRDNRDCALLSSSFKDDLKNILRNSNKKGIVLIFDEAEYLGTIENGACLEIFRNIFPDLENYLLVLSGKTDLFTNLSEAFSPIERFFSIRILESLSLEEVSELMIQHTRDQDIKFRQDAIGKIFRLSQGSPYLTQLYCYYSYQAAIENRASYVDGKLVDAGANEILVSEKAVKLLEQFTATYNILNDDEKEILKCLAFMGGDAESRDIANNFYITKSINYPGRASTDEAIKSMDNYINVILSNLAIRDLVSKTRETHFKIKNKYFMDFLNRRY